MLLRNFFKNHELETDTESLCFKLKEKEGLIERLVCDNKRLVEKIQGFEALPKKVDQELVNLRYENEKLKRYITKTTGVIELSNYSDVVNINTELRKLIKTSRTEYDILEDRYNRVLGIQKEDI